MTGLIFTPVFILGVFGLSGATLLWPLVAKQIAPRKRSAPASGAAPKRIAILIPAHNESATLPSTLRSIASAKDLCISEYPHLEIKLALGADGCTDNTEELGRKFGAEVAAFSPQAGKWRTLTKLIESHEDYDWVALVDSGTLWPRELLFKIVPLLSEQSCMAIAPSYFDEKSGKVASLLWKFERWIKNLESEAGGPVSAHGATVFYRSAELGQALKTLEGSEWRNDDVVIPLTLRTLFPKLSIKYCSEIRVFESTAEEQNAFPRRQRVVLGNLEWIATLFPVVLRENPTVALLALRRVFRVFWAYWMVLVIVPGALAFVPAKLLLVTVVIAAIALRNHRTARSLTSAFAASLSAPLYFINRQAFVTGRWR